MDTNIDSDIDLDKNIGHDICEKMKIWTQQGHGKKK